MPEVQLTHSPSPPIILSATKQQTHAFPLAKALDATVLPLQPGTPVPGTQLSSRCPHMLGVIVVSSLETGKEGK